MTQPNENKVNEPSGYGTKKTDARLRRQQILELALLGKKQREIAQLLGIETRTVTEYTRQPSFKKELAYLQQTRLEAMANQSAELMGQAQAELTSILNNPQTSTRYKLEAIKLIQDSGFKFIEVTQLASQVEQLKSVLEQRELEDLDG